MSGDAPLSQLQEAQKLTADALCDLFQITLAGAPGNPTVYFTSTQSVTWQGNAYEALPCKISAITRSSTEQKTRPTLIVMNPVGLFNAPALAGYFEGSQLIHYRVLYQHVLADAGISSRTFWRVSRVFGIVAGQSLSMELRAISDGPAFTIPARKYMPDEGFPFVTL